VTFDVVAAVKPAIGVRGTELIDAPPDAALTASENFCEKVHARWSTDMASIERRRLQTGADATASSPRNGSLIVVRGSLCDMRALAND
jgi:hypothetical protein